MSKVFDLVNKKTKDSTNIYKLMKVTLKSTLASIAN